MLKDNLVLNEEFSIEIVNKMTYAQLDKFTKNLVFVIKELTEMKEKAVLKLDDVRAVEYQRYLYNAISNRNTMLCVMMAKEGDTCEHTDIETIWLN